MKKNLFMLLFMAVALFSAATMVSCSDDDDEPVGKSMAKTTWTGTTVYAGESSTVTISFMDKSNGIALRKGKLKSDGKLVDAEVYLKFTYTFDGTKGKVTTNLMTIKIGSNMYTEAPSEVDAMFDFTYDSQANAITTSSPEIESAVLKKVSYQQIDWIEVVNNNSVG